jgi:plasmid stability protein
MAKRRVGRPRTRGQLVHLRLPKELYRTLKARAAADGRSFTVTVERLLAGALQKEATP